MSTRLVVPCVPHTVAPQAPVISVGMDRLPLATASGWSWHKNHQLPRLTVLCGAAAAPQTLDRLGPRHIPHMARSRARARALSPSLSLYIYIYIHTCACISRGASRGRPRQLETREGAGPSVSVLLGRPRPPSSAPPLQQARPPRTSPQGVARAAVRLAALVRVRGRGRGRVRARD